MGAVALWEHRNLASRTLKIWPATPGNNDLEAVLHAENSRYVVNVVLGQPSRADFLAHRTAQGFGPLVRHRTENR